MRLYLIRHPQPLVAPGVCYGRTDLAVSTEEQARIAATLAATLPRGLTMVTSPARRCTGLADALAQALGSEQPTRDDRLFEMDFGDWEMRPWEQIPRAEIDAWANDLIGYRPGGGETVLNVATRVQTFFNETRRRDTIVVCHAGTIRLLNACCSSVPVAEIALNAAREPHRIAYGECLILDDGSA